MTRQVRPNPRNHRSVTPYLVLQDAAGGIEYYTRIFGAVEDYRLEFPPGSIMHAEIKIGDSTIMICDENLEREAKSPRTLGGTPASLFLYVDDVDTVFRRSVEAGAKSIMEPADMFWGDRYAKLEDPFGHEWSLATHVEDVTPETIRERAIAAFSPQ